MPEVLRDRKFVYLASVTAVFAGGGFAGGGPIGEGIAAGELPEGVDPEQMREPAQVSGAVDQTSRPGSFLITPLIEFLEAKISS